MQTEEGPCQTHKISTLCLVSSLTIEWTMFVKPTEGWMSFSKQRDLEAIAMAASHGNIPDRLPRQHQSIKYCFFFLMPLLVPSCSYNASIFPETFLICDLSLLCNHLWGHHLNISRTWEDIEKTVFFFILKCLSKRFLLTYLKNNDCCSGWWMREEWKLA